MAKSQIITVPCEDGPQRVAAFVIGQLAVHKSQTTDGLFAGFTITEISTGRAVIFADEHCTFQEVKDVAQELSPLFDDFPVGVSLDSTEFREWSERVKPEVRRCWRKLS